MYSKIISYKKNYIIDQLGNEYIDAGNNEIRYECPFCKESGRKYKDHKLYINYNTGLYFCQRCQSKGRIKFNEDVVTPSNSQDFNNEITKFIKTISSSSDDYEDNDYYLIPKNPPNNGTLAYEYIKSRGLTDDDIKFYSIRVSSLNDPRVFKGRIIIPNKVISNRWTDQYVARDYRGSKIRYLNPKNNKTHQIVFNLHRIENNPDSIIINEGVINSIIAGYNSVATYGKYVSDTQLYSILSKKPDKIYVSLDYDAIDLAEKLCYRISLLSDSKVYLVRLEDGLDASDLGRNSYLEVVNNSIEYKSPSLYELNKLFYKSNLS